MITNKDIRVENGFLIINGDKYPLDGQSPEAIMQIVEDNSDTTPTEDSTAPITSGGVFAALAGKEDTLTFDTTPTAESANPVTSAGIKTYVDTAMGNSKIAALTQRFEDVDIASAWGSLYISNILTFDISSLGLQTPPKTVSLEVESRTASVLTIIDEFNANSIKFYISRPTSSTDVTVNISALVFY